MLPGVEVSSDDELSEQPGGEIPSNTMKSGGLTLNMGPSQPLPSLQPDREWTVERTWIVNARSAGEAFRKTAGTDPDYDRTYEGPPRPWEAE